ncbi:lamin tail domain-containing protein [Halorubrum sp. AD140]|uniref:lamin tail domain-containing protein n=1 Tax=Halorubrum sp. AD140 TaxID=3050073 RepID=UPI002ACCBEF1|nr:lamin tail domain-containing protein [Halorubrum sp. AD140]MDZ5810613.1 lamin tail domain-containing protein [Halorubrum sp. AD140]
MRTVAGRGRLLVVVAVVVLAGCVGAIPGDPTSGASDAANDSDASELGTVEVHYINVGQSVSTLVVSPAGETMLVDTGHYDDDGEHVLSYLRRHDVSRIDHLVTSHNDADHIGGHAAVIEYYETEADGIGAVYDPGIAASTQTYGEYLDAVEAHDVSLYETREGDALRFGDVDVDVLGPPEPYLESEDRNENSIVLKLTHGETQFLLSGDAEDDQEAYLVETYGSELRSTVLQAGHHGSASSSGERFLDTVRPRAVVVSSAYDSQYGHPHTETLQRLADRSVPTYWTGTHGNVVLASDGKAVSVQTQREAPTDPLSLRDGDAVEPGTGGEVTERDRLDGNGTGAIDDGDDADETPADGDSDGTISLAEVHEDAAGDDRENLTDEYVVFENTGDETLDLSGWTVEDEASHRYTFPDGVALAPDATVTLYTGSGTDTDAELYWGSEAPIWNNDGDTVIVTTSDGERVLEESYR